MHAEPVRYSKPPVEKKVKAATVGSYLGAVAVLAVLYAVKGDLTLIDFLPSWVQAIVVPLVPTAITAVSGYKADHTPRPDLGE